ncbi:UspA domain-containing protein [Thalassoporum mexicanum PCC 7367]|uniref:universal stress protein n=1 Tax=Thalassoporum mexicanum TaxID=3457544 RepID=UPI00029FED9B|nr:universal stress protein [Pseudanabaena sp. PCC 7367]AFY71054.1 UspA domain-containing protein [Pseudanabaena sp. PCC 7367]
MFNTILFPTDQTRESRHAFDLVVDVVKKYQAKLIVLSVVTPEEAESKLPAAEQFLTKIQQSLQELGITAQTKIEQGIPAFAICDVADDLNANLIVMGSKGESLLDDEQQDSVSQKVLNLSPCPVLVVP